MNPNKVPLLCHLKVVQSLEDSAKIQAVIWLVWDKTRDCDDDDILQTPFE